MSVSYEEAAHALVVQFAPCQRPAVRGHCLQVHAAMPTASRVSLAHKIALASCETLASHCFLPLTKAAVPELRLLFSRADIAHCDRCARSLLIAEGQELCCGEHC